MQNRLLNCYFSHCILDLFCNFCDPPPSKSFQHPVLPDERYRIHPYHILGFPDQKQQTFQLKSKFRVKTVGARSPRTVPYLFVHFISHHVRSAGSYSPNACIIITSTRTNVYQFKVSLRISLLYLDVLMNVVLVYFDYSN